MPREDIFRNKAVEHLSQPQLVNTSSDDQRLEGSLPKNLNEEINPEVSKNQRRDRVKKQFCVIPSSNVPNETIHKSYSSKCKPDYFSQGVKDLTERLLEDVQDLGFDGLLLMKIKLLPLGLVPWLVQNFNPHNRLQSLGNGNMYYITPDDVHDILAFR